MKLWPPRIVTTSKEVLFLVSSLTTSLLNSGNLYLDGGATISLFYDVIVKLEEEEEEKDWNYDPSKSNLDLNYLFKGP